MTALFLFLLFCIYSVHTVTVKQSDTVWEMMSFSGFLSEMAYLPTSPVSEFAPFPFQRGIEPNQAGSIFIYDSSRTSNERSGRTQCYLLPFNGD